MKIGQFPTIEKIFFIYHNVYNPLFFNDFRGTHLPIILTISFKWFEMVQINIMKFVASFLAEVLK